MPLDPLIAPLLDALNQAPKPEWTDAIDRREQARRRAGEVSPYAAFIEPPPEVAEVIDRRIPVREPAGEIAVRTYRSEAAVQQGATGAMVYLHGGGWFMGTIDEADAQCRTLAHHLDLVMVNVDYRLAPEFPFPTPPEDAFDALRWTADHLADLGVTGSWLGVGGDSAGANLAAAAALLARQRGGPDLALQVMQIPGLDLTLSSPSVQTYGRGFVLDKDDLEWCVRTYVGDHDPADPIVSPVFAADVSGLPPAVILTAECDPLADDGRRYAEKLRQAGVAVVYEEFAGQVHGSGGLTALLPTARQWRQTLLDAIRDQLAVGSAR